MGAAAYNRGSAVIRRSIKSPEAARSLTESVLHPLVECAAPIAAKPFAVGETVYCTVHGFRGIPETITAVKSNRIKVASFRQWCPAYNFQREPS